MKRLITCNGALPSWWLLGVCALVLPSAPAMGLELRRRSRDDPDASDAPCRYAVPQRLSLPQANSCRKHSRAVLGEGKTSACAHDVTRSLEADVIVSLVPNLTASVEPELRLAFQVAIVISVALLLSSKSGSYRSMAGLQDDPTVVTRLQAKEEQKPPNSQMRERRRLAELQNRFWARVASLGQDAVEEIEWDDLPVAL
ncbi:MAG: hypothetical protein SGPRY_012732 [Prymnesium sp.]